MDNDICMELRDVSRRVESGISGCCLDAANEIECLRAENEKQVQEIEKLRKLGARLAELLDEDQFAECEALLLAAGVMPEEKDNVAKA